MQPSSNWYVKSKLSLLILRFLCTERFMVFMSPKAAVAPDLWLKIVRRLKLDPATLLVRLSPNIRSTLIDNYKPSQVLYHIIIILMN